MGCTRYGNQGRYKAAKKGCTKHRSAEAVPGIKEQEAVPGGREKYPVQGNRDCTRYRKQRLS
jgi:hypothetical protein